MVHAINRRHRYIRFSGIDPFAQTTDATKCGDVAWVPFTAPSHEEMVRWRSTAEVARAGFRPPQESVARADVAISNSDVRKSAVAAATALELSRTQGTAKMNGASGQQLIDDDDEPFSAGLPLQVPPQSAATAARAAAAKAARRLQRAGWRVSMPAEADSDARSNLNAGQSGNAWLLDEPSWLFRRVLPWGEWAEIGLLLFLVQGWARSVHWRFWFARLRLALGSKAALAKET